MTSDLHHELELTISADFRELRSTRAAIGAWIDAHDIDRIRREEIVLVVSELVSNAIEASNGRHTELTVKLCVDVESIELVVIDHGPGFALDASTLPDPSAPRGRGLALVRAFTRSLTVRRRRGTTEVHARWDRRSIAADTTRGADF